MDTLHGTECFTLHHALERSQRFGERNVHKFFPESPKECKNSFIFYLFDVSAIAAGDTFGVATLIRSKHDVVRRGISKGGGIAKFRSHLAAKGWNSSCIFCCGQRPAHISIFVILSEFKQVHVTLHVSHPLSKFVPG